MSVSEDTNSETNLGALPFPDGTQFRHVAPFLIAVLSTTVVEAALLGALLLRKIHLWELLLGHLVVCGLVMAWLWWEHKRDHGVRMASLLALSTFFMGPFGSAGALLTFCVHRWQMKEAVPFERWYKSLFPSEDDDPARDLYRKIRSGRSGDAGQSSVAAFADIIALGTVQQKQAVVTLISDHFKPSFMPALRKALNDSEAAVRVQAATAMARLENRYLEQSIALEGPALAAGASTEAMRAFAEHLDDYSNSGLLDERRAMATRTQALELFQYCARLAPTDTVLAKMCGRLVLRLGRNDDAINWLSTLDSSNAQNPEIFGLRLEVLYRAARYSELRSLCRDYVASGKLDEIHEKVRQAVLLWAEAPVEESHGTA